MTIYALGDRTPQIDPDAWVAPSADVVGNVRVEAGAGIWFGAVLRGDIEPIVVGAGSNVQDLSVFHTDEGFPLTIGPNVTIGHKVMLHGCTIGEGALIGMGAIILNGAHIGRNCLVGAGALVTSGKKFEAGSLIVGSPARRLRALTEEEITDMHANTQRYVENAQRFAAQLQPKR